MIDIVGTEELESSEYQAAVELKQRILDTYPNLQDCSQDRITLLVSAKCHGQAVRDIDLLLLGTFQSGLRYRPFLPFLNKYGDLERPDEVTLRSLCAVIEIKGHASDRVRFVGTQVEVAYGARQYWHSASEQNESQKQALINYLKLNGMREIPWVTPLIWLTNIPNRDLPKRPHNILGADANCELLLNVIGQMSPPQMRSGNWYQDAEREDGSMNRIVDLFSKLLVPTGLDRRRMEQINQRVADELNLHTEVGHRMLILRGRGGTGKTVRLLQLAKRVYDDEAARVLVLTYNRALVADLRRLMTLIGIGDGLAERAIHPQTVHSFIYSVLRVLGIIEHSEEDFYEQYDTYIDEALEWLGSGSISSEDIEVLKHGHFANFAWDYILIDEAQDWPDNERNILLHLYPYSIFVVADGVDQLIRSQSPVDWRSGLNKQQAHVVPLRTSLRMKAGLTQFVASVAEAIGLPSGEWTPNFLVTGGHIHIYEGHGFERSHNIFVDIIKQAQLAGNEAIDMLFCVPPQLVARREDREESIPAQLFRQWDMPVWDGVSPAIRSAYPTDVNQLRIVQYDSCRGLEGWTVVLYALDEFYSYKLRQLETNASDNDTAHLQAARWLLIPLTRAMDTLVIHLSGKPSPVRDALQRVATLYPERVNWHMINP